MLKRTKPKILIIENQLLIAADIALQLALLGYEVLGFQSQEQATLKTIQINRPDIVLMNIKMQGKKQQLGIARSIAQDYRIPLVLISAHIDRQVLEQIKDIRVYAFIKKPFRNKDLESALKTTIDQMNKEGLRIAPLKKNTIHSI